MLIRAFLFVLILCIGCRSQEHSGAHKSEYSGIKELKCPEFRGRKLRKNYKSWHVRTPQKNEKTASVKTKNSSMFRTRIEHLQTTTDENFDLKPILHQINVEELDCPKPGMGKNLPKAVKQNIRKNNKKIRSYLKNKTESDSLRTGFPGNKPK